MTLLVRTAALLVTLLAACGGDGGANDGFRTPAAADIVGTYDLTATFARDQAATELGVGVFGLGDDLHLDLTNPPVALHGTIGRDGTLALEGYTTDSDFLRPVTARGKIEARDGVYRFKAAIDGSVPYPVTIVMERPISADLRSAAGRYQLAFATSPVGCECSSTLDLAAPIDAGGSARVGDAVESDAGGRRLATISFGVLHVAPNGRFHFETTYTPVDGPCDGFGGGPCLLQIDGALPRGDESAGTGRFTLLSALRFATAGGTVEIRHSESE